MNTRINEKLEVNANKISLETKNIDSTKILAIENKNEPEKEPRSKKKMNSEFN